LGHSADYWGFACDLSRVRDELEKESNYMGDSSFRVRLVLSRDGVIEIQHQALSPPRRLKIALAGAAVDSADPFLYHKTTHRAVYEQQLKARSDCDDVVLYNECGELTECCIGNLVLERDGSRYTLPVEAGLLAGTFRAELLAQGIIRECALTIDELAEADALYFINSVRRWVGLDLV